MAKSKKNSRKKQHQQNQGPTRAASRDPSVKKAPTAAAAAKVSSSLLAASSDTQHVQQLLPLPFPAHLPRPTGDFLRNEPPFTESFAAALETAYEGFVVDNDLTPIIKSQGATDTSVSAAASTALLSEEALQECLEQMQHSSSSYFRRDVTQPFGLGTACAPTYVTRCLVGAPGTTYKYLGLRMFAHPWSTSATTSTQTTSVTPTVRIGALAQALSARTRHHLQALDVKRQKRGAPPTQYTRTGGGGNNNNTHDLASFNICLINRMDASEKNLKDEPTVSATTTTTTSESSRDSPQAAMKMKTSVSWHADSSLEQYSTIAVYQTLVPKTPTGAEDDFAKKKASRKKNSKIDKNKKQYDNDDQNRDNGWYVALRVAHHSEGPQASRRGTGIDSAIVKETPPIAASLKSGSTYYLLDDFNHHHQHTVLSNHNSLAAKKTIRYSCTFRLLRESHTDADILGRCRSAIGNFHRKGPKLWRSEQLTLTELESEWIRQFYIQGQDHYDMLAQAYWKEPLEQFWHCWSQLERRTLQTLDLLRYAAEGKAKLQNTAATAPATYNGPPPTKSERKARDKRKKALSTMIDLLGRQVHNEGLPSNNQHHPVDHNSDDALTLMYEPMAVLLEERATMRELWAQRERDQVFAGLSPGCRPLPLPVEFECENVTGGAYMANTTKDSATTKKGESPLPGTPEKLREMAESIRLLGRVFVSGNEEDLPTSVPWDNKDSSAFSSEQKSAQHTAAHHSVSLDWSGWAQSDAEFGLELQQPWASALVSGKKTIETRLYTLPPTLLGKRLWIIQSPPGKAGVSVMGDSVEFSKQRSGAKSSVSGIADEPKIIGWCTFASIKQYTDKHSFEADKSSHMVSPDSGYGWQEGRTKTVYGWVIGESQRCDKDQNSLANDIVSGIRRMRSLFQLKRAQTNHSFASPEKKKSKNKKRASFSRHNGSTALTVNNDRPTKKKRKKRY